MIEIDPIIAAINDNQSLNSKRVLELFVDLFTQKPPDEIGRDILKDYLKISKIDENNVNKKIAGKILNEISSTEFEFYEDYLSKLEESDMDFIPFYSSEYPTRLWKISKPPLCLYVDGDISGFSNSVAVVGTRSAHDHRIEFAERIADKLVEMDRVVVSGLANGIDEAAHRGTLNANGTTFAILPGHIKKIRPASNKELGEQIRENGALVSEVSKRVGIHRGRFVERNRITSGISSAVVIGASGETGGTIHQANFAQEQEKSRFLYSPETDDGQSPEKLVNKGFKPFETIDELEYMLNEDLPSDYFSSKPATLDDFC